MKLSDMNVGVTDNCCIDDLEYDDTTGHGDGECCLVCCLCRRALLTDRQFSWASGKQGWAGGLRARRDSAWAVVAAEAGEAEAAAASNNGQGFVFR